MDYIKEPLYVSVVNPLDKNNIRTYYFLGNIPNFVLQAAQDGNFNENSKTMEWKRDSRSTLKDFYGPSWEAKLTGEEPTEMRSGFNLYSNIIWGGDDFGDLTFFDKDVFEEPELELKKNEFDFIDNAEISSKIIYSNVSVYPEDNLYDLRLKIHLLTKIPVYRQFMFYYVNGQGPYYTYQISINKIPYTIRWSDMLYESKLNVCGIGIDPYFEQNKHDIEIISFDLGRLLENKKGHRVNKVYVIDLFDILRDRSVKNTIVDKYQFDLLYYGFIIKYWPQLTPDAFKLAINDSEKLTLTYPRLNNDFMKLYNRQVLEQQLINKTYKYMDHINYTMAITQSNIVVHSKMIKMNTNIRNIFDILELNNNIYAMFINFKHGLRKYRYYSKKHASVMNKDIYVHNSKDTLSICIKGVHQIVINISREGSYEVSSQWLEDDLVSFDNIIDKLSKYVNPVIKQINDFGPLVFPMGGNLNILKDAIFNMIIVSLYYPFIFTLSEFNGLKNAFKQYEEIGIIRTQGLQISRSFIFTFNKGIIDSNFVYDSYTWLYEESNDIGRHIRIVHRTDRLQIEILNIKNIMEYEIIKRYVFTTIDNYIKDNKIKKEKKVDDTKIKSIRKLHDLDPDLYNLHKYSNKVQAYSILCQSGRQPSIYDEEMIKSLSKEKQQRIVKYWNFTHNKPAYYSCSDAYPHINFITDKHPKGYCLPCCKKLKDTPGTKVAEINQSCLQNKLFQTEEGDISTYILNYGKKIIPGRLCNIPPELSKTMFESSGQLHYYIYGVKQTSNVTDTNIGFISSLKFIFGDDCINELANLVKDMKQYYTLANGKAGIYKSANEMYMELISNFVNYSNSLLMNTDMDTWTHILTDLIRFKYNVEMINIVNDNETFHLKAYQDAAKSINNGIDVSITITDENGTNPITYLNHKDFIKNNVHESIFASKICKQFFVIADKQIMDLTFIISFAKKNQYEINELYINMKNLCYAVNMKIDGNDIYLPILASNIPHKNTIELNYGIRPKSETSKTELMRLIDNINNYRKDSITIMNTITYDNKLIGLVSTDQLCYYHRPTNYDIKENNVEFPYDPRDIDSTILQRDKNDKLSDQALLKKYYNNLYKLFFSEFTTILQKDKNTSMRKKIISVINDTDFMNSKSIQTLIQSLDDLLKKYPTDLNTIHNFIEFVYFNSVDTSEISKFIDISRFEFDFKLLEELRSISDNDQLIKKLHEIMDSYVIIDEINKVPQHYNIYTSCINDTNQFFCKDSKIIIPRQKIDDVFDALANDVMNKSKTYLMMIGSSGIFDYLEFIERPHEFIEISEIKDML